jgi:Ni,Fe-hydrogenase III large subunit
MNLQQWYERADLQAGSNAGATVVDVGADEWLQASEDLAGGGARLLSLWAGPDGHGDQIVRAAFVADPGVLILCLALRRPQTSYPPIERIFPAAGRMQRAIADLCGLHACGEDARPWLRHAAWPKDFLPLVDALDPASAPAALADQYAFVSVDGEGVHEIPVGPVHAGIIEPGHFRFSVVGEKVLRLEERLGYVHKGIERRFTTLPLLDGHRLAARVSGDSAVAFSWAYCQALEAMAAARLPARALWLRALALELERLANHLGDIGALGNDAGFAFGLSQLSRLKEQLMRANLRAFGQRYLMDYVLPGGTRVDLPAAEGIRLVDAVESIAHEVEAVRAIYEDHSGLRDRFVGAGIVAPELARRLGLTGLSGRASGQAFDLRCDLPWPPYGDLAPRKIVRAEGDVAARVSVRFDEVRESVRLVQQIVRSLPAGEHQAGIPEVRPGAFGVGLLEGWRGPVLVALEAGEGGGIRRCHPHDPSWLNWPLLEHAIIDNIVPDFPLINKSFNLSYSGHDL